MGGGREGEGLGPELIPKLFPIPFELIPKPYLGCLVGLGLWAREGGWGGGFGLELISKLGPIPLNEFRNLSWGAVRNRLPARIGVVGGGREGEGLGPQLIPKLFPIPF